MQKIIDEIKDDVKAGKLIEKLFDAFKAIKEAIEAIFNAYKNGAEEEAE